MFFDPADKLDDASDDDEDAAADGANDTSFGSQRELNYLRQKQGNTAAKAKANALQLFRRVDNLNEQEDEKGEQQYSYSVVIPASKATTFNLAVRYKSCGTSFRMASEVITCTYDVLDDPRLRHCRRQDVSNYIRVVCAVNLQHISDILCQSWGFSLALDSATHHSTSYLDIRFRVFVKKEGTIVGVHGCALPMFDRHTGEVMFDIVAKFLNVLCPEWKIRLIGVASDGARNMTGRVAGVVTRLASAMHENCPLTRIWCGAHQLDLVMEYIMNNVVKERFFGTMTAFITHLTRQLNLIAEMKTTCPSNRQPMAVNSNGHKMVQDPPSRVACVHCIKESCIGTVTSLVGFIAGYAALYKLHVRYLLFHSRLNNVVGAAAGCIERPCQFVEGGCWSDRSAHCRNDCGSGSINPCYRWDVCRASIKCPP